MTDIGPINQAFQVLNRTLHSEKNSAQKVELEQNFAEVFSKLATQNVQKAVIQNAKISGGEIAGSSALGLRPKNKSSDELEKETLKKLVEKLEKMAVKWLNEKRSRR